MFKDRFALLKIFLALAAAESALAAYALAAIPADAKNALWFGFSPARLALLGATAALLAASLGGWLWLSLRTTAAPRLLSRLDSFFADEKKKNGLIFACGFIAAGGFLFLLIPPERAGAALYQRAQPLAALALLLSLQTLLWQFLHRGETLRWERIKNPRPILAAAALALSGFLALWAFAAWSGIGLTPEQSGWLAPGAPVLPQQVLFAWSLGAALLFFEKRLDRFKRADALFAALMWLAAGLLWNLQPMTRWGYFTPEPTPPNFEYYPHSDAALYDEYSQNILIGAGWRVGVFIRPLYVFLLAALHAVFGPKYDGVIAVQTWLLAAIPALTYLLGAKLGGRPAGVTAAVLMILREKNAIALTNIIEISHSKLLMSDLPTMALLLAFLFFVVLWLAEGGNRAPLGALAGAFFGLAAMIRSQNQFLLPVVLLGIAAFKWDGWKPVSRRILLFLLGAALVVLPWMLRNYLVSGSAVIEYPGSFTRQFAGIYDAPAESLEFLPGETQEQYRSRMTGLILQAMLADPWKIFRKYLSYFVRNEILSVAYLPMSPRFDDLYAYVNSLPFWKSPAQPFPARALPFFVLSLCFIALGAGTAFQRTGWAGAAFPLLFHFLYSFSVTLIFISGWRFIQPVDWVSLLFLSVGLTQATAWAFALFSARFAESAAPQARDEKSPAAISWGRLPLVLGLIAAFGVSLPLFEAVFPERYPALPPQALIEKYLSREIVLPGGETLSAARVEAFLQAEPKAAVEYGRALYPSFYKKEGYWGDAPYLKQAKLYNRLEFRLIGAKRVPVFLPLETAPSYFPHAADVFLVGCESPNAIRALIVIVNDRLVTTSPWNGLTCDEP